MVGADPQGHIDLVVATGVGLSGRLAQVADQRLEDVGVVVALFALKDGGQTLEAHARVDVLGWKRFEAAIRLPHELHEDEVPDFDDLRMVLVHQVGTRNGGPVGCASDVDVDFGARSARPRFSHLPEVVLLVGFQDALGRHVLEPDVHGLLVEGQSVPGVAFKHGDVEAVFVDAIPVGQQFPGPVNGLPLEVVPKRPIAEHLEHGVVVGVHAHFFKVVVLAADAEAFLGVGHPGRLGGAVAEEDVLERIHPRIGEHQSGVVLQHHRGGGDDLVGLFTEEIEERAADVGGVHGSGLWRSSHAIVGGKICESRVSRGFAVVKVGTFLYFYAGFF